MDAAIADAAAALDTIIDAVGDAASATHGSTAPVLVLAYYNPDLRAVATETIVSGPMAASTAIRTSHGRGSTTASRA